MDFIDVRSDTGTDMTASMRQAILDAHYADHLYGEDLNVLKLQKMAAEFFGKEAASFVISGVFGNQVSIMTAGQPGTQIILCDKSHIITYENGSVGRLSRMMTRTISCDESYFMSATDIEANIRKVKDMQAPKQTILAIENPTSSGRIYPLQKFRQIIELGKKNGLHVHLDGARLLHACTELDIQPKEITKGCDSVMVCLSKGLCTPIGSIVLGSKDFINKFNQNRKMLGGILRKPGQIAAMGIIALNQIKDSLKRTHKMALLLAQKISKFAWIELVQKIEMNMVFFEFRDDKIKPAQLWKFLRDRKIISTISMDPKGMNRFVTHYHITQVEVDRVVNALQEYYKTKCDQ